MYYKIVLDSLSVMLWQDSTVQKGSDILFCISNTYLMTALQRLCTRQPRITTCASVHMQVIICMTVALRSGTFCTLISIHREVSSLDASSGILELSVSEVYREAPDPPVFM